MKRHLFRTIAIIVFIPFCFSLQGPSNVYSQPDFPIGVQPLLDRGAQTLPSLIPASIRPLFLAPEIEQLLQELEGHPPDWTQLRHADITEQSERLFQLNRQRDEIRTKKKALLQQPVAFVWAGILRQYLPEYQGFSLALGPELTTTSWGTIRFKPIDLPDYLVTVPSPTVREQLLARQRQGEQIEIIVVFIGRLIPGESIIYAFSHEGHQEGMILPVVSVQRLLYVLKSP